MNIVLRRSGIWFLSAFFRKALTVIGHFLLMNSFIFYADDKKWFENPASGPMAALPRLCGGISHLF
jgi:hypothetical protein